MELIAGVIGSAMVIGAASLTLMRLLHRAPAVQVVPTRLEPQSLVHLIESEDELHDVARRAAQFDRDAAEQLLNRVPLRSSCRAAVDCDHPRRAHATSR